MTTDQLHGKNVLITGASRGIGRALTEEALARGVARVYAAVRRPDSMQDACAVHGDRIVPVVLDLGEPATIAALAEQCPDVDVLVHNAGVPLPGAALDVPMPDLRTVFETNFFGPLELLRAFAAPIAARGGGVLVVTSQAGLILSRSSPLYSASKAALTMAVLGMRAQLRGAGVPVALVFPGMVATEMTAAMSGPKTAPDTVAANVFDAYARGERAIFPDAHSQEVRTALHEHYLETLDNPQLVAELALVRLVEAATQ
jgi:NAD(P)-dependent dehydrogenase (short-subunit alcohol dehydrogenase family)